MNPFNSNYCNSVKNKNNINLQCQYKHKPNEIFCGVHLNSTNIILYKFEENITNNAKITENLYIEVNNFEIDSKLDFEVNKPEVNKPEVNNFEIDKKLDFEVCKIDVSKIDVGKIKDNNIVIYNKDEFNNQK